MPILIRSLLLLVLLFPSIADSGSLKSPAPPDKPGSAMYSLEDIYQRLALGTEGQKREGAFQRTTSKPGPTGHTLDQILDASPLPIANSAALPADVKVGRKFWGLSPQAGWGQQTGTAGERVAKVVTDPLLDAIETNKWLETVTIGDIYKLRQSSNASLSQLLRESGILLNLIAAIDTPALQIPKMVAFSASERLVIARLAGYAKSDLALIKMKFADLNILQDAGMLNDWLFRGWILKGEVVDLDKVSQLIAQKEAGKLDPPLGPDEPNANMPTLDDIYHRLASGAAPIQPPSLSPQAGPGSTGHNLNEIMAVAPQPDPVRGARPGDVNNALVFWSLSPNSWGTRTGIGGQASMPNHSYILEAVDYYDWLPNKTLKEIKEAYSKSTLPSLEEFLEDKDVWLRLAGEMNTSYLKIPDRFQYDPAEMELLHILAQVGDAKLRNIKMSFADLLLLYNAGYLANDALPQAILDGLAIDVAFLNDPIAFLNGKRAGFISASASYPDRAWELIRSVAWLTAINDIDLTQLPGFNQGQGPAPMDGGLLGVVSDPDFSFYPINDIVLFFGSKISIADPSVLVFNPKIVPDIPLVFKVPQPTIIDSVKLQVLDASKNAVDTLHDGPISGKELVLIWSGRKAGKMVMDGGTYQLSMLVEKHSANGSKTISRTINWDPPPGQTRAIQAISGPLSINPSFTGNKKTQEAITKDSSNEFVRDVFEGKIIKFEIVDNIPQVYFVDGISTESKTTQVNASVAGLNGATVSSQTFDIFMPQSSVRIDYGVYASCGWGDWWWSDCLVGKVYVGDSLSQEFKNHSSTTRYVDITQATTMRIEAINFGIFGDIHNSVAATYKNPTVWKLAGTTDQASIAKASADLYGPYTKALLTTTPNRAQTAEYEYYYAPPLVDANGEGTLILKRLKLSDNSVSFIEIPGKFETGDIHLQLSGDSLWLCWLGTDTQDLNHNNDINDRVPKTMRVNLAEYANRWQPDDIKLLIRYAENYKIDLKGFLTDNILSEADRSLLGQLQGLVTWHRDSYVAVSFARIKAHLTEGHSLKASYLLAFIEANPERFYAYGTTFAESPKLSHDVTRLLKKFADEDPVDTLLTAVQYGVITGVAPNPYDEPEMEQNNFNSSNGMRLSETDLSIQYLGQPIFQLNRTYDSGGAQFKPSVNGINREQTVLPSFLREHDVKNILPLVFKAPVSGFGNGWNNDLDGTVLLNYLRYKNYEPSENKIEGNLSFSIKGSILNYKFHSDSPDLPLNLEAIEKNTGFQVKISAGNSAPTYGNPELWVVELVDKVGTRYRFNDLTINKQDKFEGRLHPLIGNVKDLYDLYTVKRALKLSEVEQVDGVKLSFVYGQVSSFNPEVQYVTETVANTYMPLAGALARNTVIKNLPSLPGLPGSPTTNQTGLNMPSIDLKIPYGNECLFVFNNLSSEEKVKQYLANTAIDMALKNAAVDTAVQALTAFAGPFMIALKVFDFLKSISETKIHQVYDADIHLLRLNSLEISKAGQAVNTLNFYYRRPGTDLVLPDYATGLQIKKIEVAGQNGTEKEIWYRYDNAEMLSGVEVDREEKARYAYAPYNSEIFRPEPAAFAPPKWNQLFSPVYTIVKLDQGQLKVLYTQEEWETRYSSLLAGLSSELRTQIYNDLKTLQASLTSTEIASGHWAQLAPAMPISLTPETWVEVHRALLTQSDRSMDKDIPEAVLTQIMTNLSAQTVSELTTGSTLLPGNPAAKYWQGVYDYNEWKSRNVPGKTYLLTDIYRQNGKIEQYRYSFNDMKYSNFADLTEAERKSGSQFLLSKKVIDGQKTTSIEYSSPAVYTPYKDSAKNVRSFYFQKVETTRPDGIKVVDEFDNALPKTHSIPAMNQTETMVYDPETRLLSSKEVNDNDHKTQNLFSLYQQGEATWAETKDMASGENEIHDNLKAVGAEAAKANSNQAALLGANLLSLPEHEITKDIKPSMSTDNALTSKDLQYFYGDGSSGKPYLGALWRSIGRKDLADWGGTPWEGLLLGDFLTLDNVTQNPKAKNSRTVKEFTYDTAKRVSLDNSDLLKTDYTYETVTENSAKYLLRHATTHVKAKTVADLQTGVASQETGVYSKTEKFDLATGLLLAETDTNNLTTTYEYDQDNRMTRKSYPDGTEEKWVYDVKGRELTYTDRNGVSRKDTYNTEGKVVISDYLTPELADTTTVYDLNNNPITTLTFLDSTVFAEQWATFDALGRQTSMNNSRGESLLTTYKPNKVTEVVKNDKTKLSTTNDSFGAVKAIELRDYTANGNPLLRSVAVSNGKHHSPEQITFSRPGQALPGLNRTRKNEADGAQILHQTAEGLQQVAITGTGFTESKRALNGSVAEQLLTLQDGLGRPLSVSRKIGTTWQQRLAFVYDETDLGGAFQKGQLTRASTYLEGSLSTANRFVYDQNGKLVREQVETLGQQFTLNQEWKAGKAGLLAKLVVKKGANEVKAIGYRYDYEEPGVEAGSGVGRLTGLTIPVNGVDQTFTFAYLPTGQLSQIDYPNGLQVDRGYNYTNQSGNLETITVSRGGTPVRTLAYTYSQGLITGKSDTITETLPGLQTYDKKETYTHDPEGTLVEVQRTASDNSAWRDTFEYDGAYNLKRHLTAPLAAAKDSGQVITYSYAEGTNRLTGVSGNATAAAQGWPNVALAYDSTTLRPSGITWGTGSQQTLAYDEFNHQLRDGADTYAMDYKGQRVASTKNAATERRLYDQSGNLLAEIDATGACRAVYVWGPEGLLLAKLSMVAATGVQTIEYYHHDHLGSNIMASSGAGATVAHNQYSVWGLPKAVYPQAGSGSFIFTGKLWDIATRSYNLGARTYYPELKRFLVGDPVLSELDELKTYNEYLYASNDPVNYIDPDGKSAKNGNIDDMFFNILDALENLEGFIPGKIKFIKSIKMVFDATMLFSDKMEEANGGPGKSIYQTQIDKYESLEGIYKALDQKKLKFGDVSMEIWRSYSEDIANGNRLSISKHNANGHKLSPKVGRTWH